MARSFNVSTIFTAINRLNAPVAAMGRQISAFAHSVRTSSTFASTSLGSIAGAASSAALRIGRALNSITFAGLQNRLSAIRNQLHNLSSGISNAGNTAMGLGAGGIAAGYGVSKTLDAVRIAESQRARMGTLYNPHGTTEEKLATGKKHEEAIANMAIKLPGEAKDFVNFAALLKNYGVDYSEKLFTNFTDLAGGAGVKLDDLFMEQITSMLAGNRNMLDDKWGLKSGSEGGMNKLTELGTGKVHSFKTQADEIAFLQEWSKKKGYTGMTEATMKGTEGMESNVSDVLAKVSKNVWEDSGALDVYKSKIVEFTDACKLAIAPLTNLVRPIADWAKQNKELFNTIIIGIPGLILFGAALKVIAFAITPFAALFSVTGIALAALGAAAYYVYSNWDKFKEYIPTFETIKNSIKGITDSFSGAVNSVKQFAEQHPLLTKFVATFAAIAAAVVLLPQILGLGIVAFGPILRMGTMIASAWAGIPTVISGIVAAFAVLTGPVLIAIGLFAALIAFQPELENLGRTIGSSVFDGVQSATKYVNDLGARIGSAIFDGVQVAKGYFDSFIQFITSPVDFSPAIEPLKSIFNAAVEYVKSLWSSFKNWLLTPIDFSSMWSSLSTSFSSAIDSVKSMWSGFSLGSISAPKVNVPNVAVPKTTAPPMKSSGSTSNALSDSRANFLQKTSYNPNVNVSIDQTNTHNVSAQGVKTTTINKVNGGNLKYNNNTKTGAGRRTNPSVANGVYNA